MVLQVLDVLAAVVLAVGQVGGLFALAVAAERRKRRGAGQNETGTAKLLLVLVVLLPLAGAPAAYGLWQAGWWVSALAEGGLAVTFGTCILKGLVTVGGRPSRPSPGRIRGPAALRPVPPPPSGHGPAGDAEGAVDGGYGPET
ncbi:hypothetical protein RM572_13735 [Streptomyces sp. DSM 42041]|uniref:DUF2892 domain-containing protein n=1 Tax=Streptomyces hazeniae TaxID=3075538 RepID=A0ABU2NT82_9ACTN|nr:hypothetical protein [Streptomyces sp. DSM 42041]MDT0379821.1 hypothetical protein [Streptomyces sp. DSM 42041]